MKSSPYRYDKTEEMTQQRILFFRRKSDRDGYETQFMLNGWRVRSVEVLQTDFVYREQLETALKSPESFRGLVFTSSRAVAAIHYNESVVPDILQPWKKKPVFGVGPATKKALEALGFDVLGADSGEASQLAEYIVEYTGGEKSMPLLFLCGNRRRDELRGVLYAAGVPLVEQEVYRIYDHPSLTLIDVDQPDWVVFFSPSGVEVVHKRWPVKWKTVSLAAIGSTTARSVRDTFGNVEAVATSPTPEGVFTAIRKAQKFDSSA